MNLRKQTIKGIKWALADSYIQRIISFATTIVLARILDPSTFGLFALAFVVIDGFGLFKSMGFDSALIQRNEDIEKSASTAFFIIPLLGVAIYLIIFFVAPIASAYLNCKELIPILKVLGLIFILNCFGKVPNALLQKNLRFKQISLINCSIVFVYSISAIILALSGHGIWSLVIAYIIRTSLGLIMVWSFANWKPKFEFDKRIALEMFSFGKFLFLGAVVWYLKSNCDRFLIGKLLGTTMLGFYAIAYNFANFGRQYFGAKVSKVLFPAYAKIQTDLNDIKSVFLKILKYVCLLSIPLSIGIFIMGGDFLKFAFGEKWIGATSVLRILAWAGLFNAISVAIGPVFLALGKSKISFYITSVEVLIFFVSIVPLAKLFGINGVGIVVVVASFIAFAINLTLVMKLLSITSKEIFSFVKPVLISSFFMTVGLMIIKIILMNSYLGSVPSLNFLTLLFFALTVYCLSLHKTDKLIFRQIKELVF
jgi:O-antigen/teichoic acid export membrane protein